MEGFYAGDDGEGGGVQVGTTPRRKNGNPITGTSLMLDQ